MDDKLLSTLTGGQTDSSEHVIPIGKNACNGWRQRLAKARSGEKSKYHDTFGAILQGGNLALERLHLHGQRTA